MAKTVLFLTFDRRNLKTSQTPVLSCLTVPGCKHGKHLGLYHNSYISTSTQEWHGLIPLYDATLIFIMAFLDAFSRRPFAFAIVCLEIFH